MHPKRKQLQPFSLILEPSELAALRKIADSEKTSVATFVRGATHSVLYRANPGLVDRMVQAELDGFLKGIAEKFSGIVRTGSRTRALKAQILKALG